MTEERIQQAIIQMECQQHLNRVTSLTDRADWEALADCYTEDAVLARPSDPNNPIVGKDAILASFKNRPPRITAHLLGNTVFDIVEPTKVTATSRVWLVAGPVPEGDAPALSEGPILVGTFTDYLVWKDGRWLTNRRDGSIELKHS